MSTIFFHALRRSVGGVLGWGIALALLAAYLMGLHDAFMEQQVQYLSFISAYPPELMAFFGDISGIFDAAGFLNFTTFSYLPLAIGFYALLSGSGLLAADEEKGTLDLVLAHPVSRTQLLFGRLAALILAMAIMLLLGWLGFALTAPQTTLGLDAGQLLLPFISLYGLMIFLAGLALLLSMLLPSRSMASAIAGLILFVSYFITTLERLDEGLSWLADFSPLNYYQGGLAVDGLNLGWLLGLLGVGLIFILLAGWRFQRRDIRVGGEGSWQFARASRGEKKSNL